MGEYRESRDSEQLEKIDITNMSFDILRGVKKLWWLVIGLAVLFGGASYLKVTSSYVPTYVASATMSVSSTSVAGAYVDIDNAEKLAEIFPYILTSGVLHDVIAEDMGKNYVPGNITAKTEDGTNLFTVSVSSSDPQQAYDVLQSVIKNYPKVAEYVVGETKLDILDETGVPEDTGREMIIRGSYKRGALQGAIIGLVIMLIYVLTRRTVKSRNELRRIINLESYGSVPFIALKKRRRSKNKRQLNLLDENVAQEYLEAIRKLRIKIMSEMEKKNYHSLMITSSIPGEGKSTIAVNLAAALAKQGKRVIVVDGDARNPSVAGVMDEKEPHPGFGKVIRGEATIEEALVKIPVDEGFLGIMYGGERSERDSRMLGTPEVKHLIEELEAISDIVIIDTAPSELLADAPAIAKNVDAAIYIIKYDCAKRRQIRDGIRSLAMSGVDILGYVFNADQVYQNRNMSYGYNYGYKKYGHYGHYGHYSTKKAADKSGRVLKE